jgi:hypothetical protein
VSRRRPGAVYLLCWAKTPYYHAGHYLGFAYPSAPGTPCPPSWLDEIMSADRPGRPGGRGPRLTPDRIAGLAATLGDHKAGQHSKLTRAVTSAGIEWRLVRVWPGATEATEKWLKDLNDRRRLCPVCTPGTRAGAVPGAKRFRRRRPKMSPAMRKSPLSYSG